MYIYLKIISISKSSFLQDSFFREVALVNYPEVFWVVEEFVLRCYDYVRFTVHSCSPSKIVICPASSGQINSLLAGKPQIRMVNTNPPRIVKSEDAVFIGNRRLANSKDLLSPVTVTMLNLHGSMSHRSL